MNYKIGCAVPETVKGKATTFGYQTLDTDDEAKFIKAINTFATIPVAVTGGHRHMDNITEIFGWLRFDLDEEGEEAILEPLIQDYYYIKKPSTNNEEYPYKWHYFVQVSNPAQNYDQFKDQVLRFCELAGIELKDMAVTNSVTQNMNPYKGDLKKAIELTTVNEGKTLVLPEPREIAPTPVSDGIHFTDLDTGEVSEVVVGMGSDELRERLATIDAACDRTTWMAYNASAYNIASDKKEARNLCLEWSQTANNFTEDGFEDLWVQIENGTFGKKYKGGMLIKDSNDSGYRSPENSKDEDVFEELCDRINNADTIDEIKDLVKEAKKLKYVYQVQIPARMSARTTVIDKPNKLGVNYFKSLFDLPGVKKREEAKAKKENTKGMAEFIGAYYDSALGEYYIVDKRDNKLHKSKQQGLISVGNGLRLTGEVVRDFVISKNKLISKYTQETDYLTKEEISFTERPSSDPSAPIILANLINPLINVPTAFNGDMDVVEDFFKTMWNGKAEDVIRLIGLTMRFKEAKLNKIHLVAPSNFGKTNLLEQIGFQTIVMKRLLPALNAEKGIGKGIIDGLKSSGLLLIDEANNPLDQSIKDIDNYMQLDQFGQGGTQEIKLHYTVMTSTHKTAVRGMSDEMYNRLLLVELTAGEAGHPIDKSELFIKNSDHYTKNVKEYSLWLLKDALLNPDYSMIHLKKLQAKYRLELNSDTDEMLVEVSDRVVSEFKSLVSVDGNVLERNGAYLIKRKTDLVSAIEDRFSEYAHIDKGKYTDILTNHFLGAQKSVRLDGRPVKYYLLNLKTYYATVEDEQEATVMGMITNLDTGEKLDEVDEFLS